MSSPLFQKFIIFPLVTILIFECVGHESIRFSSSVCVTISFYGMRYALEVRMAIGLYFFQMKVKELL